VEERRAEGVRVVGGDQDQAGALTDGGLHRRVQEER
jgi:hypothetical protein